MPDEEEIEISLEIPEEEKPPPEVVEYYECDDNITPFGQNRLADTDSRSSTDASERSGLSKAQPDTPQQT